MSDRLDEILFSLEWGATFGDMTTDMRTKFKQAIDAYTTNKVIEELESLKQFNGAVIGIDGKRVDHMTAHSIIDDRINALALNHRKDEDE